MLQEVITTLGTIILDDLGDHRDLRNLFSCQRSV